MELIRKSLYHGLRTQHINRLTTNLTALSLTRNYCALKQLRPSISSQSTIGQHFKLLQLSQNRRNLVDQASKSSISESLDEAKILSLPSNIKVIDENITPAAIVTKASSGLIDYPTLTFASINMNFMQKLFFLYHYPIVYSMDFLLGFMPGWIAILTLVSIMRILQFPLMIKQNVIAIKTNNLAPQTQKIQLRSNEAFAAGDTYTSNVQRAKLQALHAEHGLTTFKRLWPSLVQAPAFCCMFFTFRNLADYKMNSMTTGGALWFTDLTVADPTYILPALACGATYLLVRYGVATTFNVASARTKWFVRILPVGMFYLIHQLPSAVMLFWTLNNLVSLSVSLMFRTSIAKRVFKIPERIEHKASDLPLSNMSFFEHFKSMNAQVVSPKTSMNIRRMDATAFRRAGVEPIKKTYKNPPSNLSR